MTEYVTVGTCAGGQDIHVYHTGDCHNAPGEQSREMELSLAKQRGLEECSFCSGKATSATGEDSDPLKYIRKLQQ